MQEDVVLTELQDLTGEAKDRDSFRQISIDDYAKAVELSNQRRFSPNKVALVYAEGEIVSGNGTPNSIGGDRLTSLLRELRLNDDVKAIVLRVNSPGGSATASALIAREVSLIKQRKPIMVSMGSYAASGGYQISTYASRIFAVPSTITGSIGVFGLLPNVKALANQHGITWDVVKTGKLADGNTIARPRTPEELAIAQQVVDRLYEQFLKFVSESRSLPSQKVAEIAQGRVWSGTAAKTLGLVDELGGLEAAIQAAVEAAKLGDDWQIEEYPQAKSFEARLFRKLLNGSASLTGTSPATPNQSPVASRLQRLQDDLTILQGMNDPHGAYSRLPFELEIR